ncbi:CopG family transcriptional regulator [Alkalimonas mucilaginosa]|uniref:CopG family transcriptional regulator n=1 Tax=Alkalimonas mucilaginosa TaxID=3057676 RepID=A0ABU7JJT0_9GAMM|nr:CopG family transcriptional regulator [Alkalimonas sp. MEB004]MEE2025935.1 CopG family transcriptional regulator [Alkalimonas sp. MEB004]
MGQISIYLDDDSESKIAAAAKACQLTTSEWLAEFIRQELSKQWSKEVYELAGVWPDFPIKSQGRQADDTDNV